MFLKYYKVTETHKEEKLSKQGNTHMCVCVCRRWKEESKNFLDRLATRNNVLSSVYDNATISVFFLLPLWFAQWLNVWYAAQWIIKVISCTDSCSTTKIAIHFFILSIFGCCNHTCCVSSHRGTNIWKMNEILRFYTFVWLMHSVFASRKIAVTTIYLVKRWQSAVTRIYLLVIRFYWAYWHMALEFFLNISNTENGKSVGIAEVTTENSKKNSPSIVTRSAFSTLALRNFLLVRHP